MRYVDFASGEHYHVFDRGVGRQVIFHDAEDFTYFLKLLCACNTTATCQNRDKNPQPLVSVVSYTLLPNHFHLQLVEAFEHGVSRYMHNLKRLYSCYYNHKHNRGGTLYQAPFGVKPVISDAHFEHLPRYIHLNILDLTDHDWRAGLVHDWKAALDTMLSYPWSSHAAYLTKSQMYPILDLSIIEDLFSSDAEYLEFLRSWSQSDIALANLHFIDSSK